MKESVTKFDLEAAFKALDELDIPVAKKGIAANRVNLKETFNKKLKTEALLEDYYDINDTNDLEQASEERAAEVAKAKLARIEKIVDLDADTEEDILPSYEGKIIVQCPQCMTLFYKNPEDVEASEEDDTVVNVGEVCQHCGNESGYTVIGKVAAVEPEVEEEPTDLNDLDNESEELPLEDESEEEPMEEASEEEPVEDESEEELDLSEIPDEDEEEPEEEKKEESLNTQAKAILTEARDEELDIEENEELTEDAEVSDADFKELMNSDEYKTPISVEEVKSYWTEAFDEVSIKDGLDSVEDVEEDELNNVITEALKRVYENVESFTITECALNNNKFAITGTVKFNSGNTRQMSYIFNEAKISKKNADKIILEGINTTLDPEGKFYLESMLTENKTKLVSNKLNYSYHVNNNLVEKLK